MLPSGYIYLLPISNKFDFDMYNTVKEKDKENTKNKLLKALGEIIISDGFESVGVNNVASKAGVSKILIYRYFGTLENMILEYLSENDFWINFSVEFPNNENLREFMKKLFRSQISQLRSNKIMIKLQRWELNEKNTITDKLRLKQEAKGITIVTIISQLSKSSQEEVAAMSSILSAAISYLILLSDHCPLYNGIDIQSDKGWEQITKGMDLLIDLWYDSKNINQ